jgi:hypothetical protein
MKKITLTNDFHNTEATVIPVLITEGRFSGKYKISRKTAQRLHRELCGSKECCCGDTFGARGGNRFEIVNEDFERNYIVEWLF